MAATTKFLEDAHEAADLFSHLAGEAEPISAVLHDAVEDQGGVAAEAMIRRRFDARRRRANVSG
jgi:hypothetical protein